MQNLPHVVLSGIISTNYFGIRRIFNFYYDAQIYRNQTIFIDFSELEWIDANLSSLFYAVLFKLKKENKLEFETDEKIIEQKFHVLLRNGLFIKEKPLMDERQSTVVLKKFFPSEELVFIKYIREELLEHRGMPKFSERQKQAY